VARGTVEVARAVIDTLQLTRTLQELDTHAERGARESELRPQIDALHRMLIRPVEGRLGPPETPLVIVADGELSAVPFAALGPRSSEYLITSHPLRFAVSLAEAKRPPPVRTPGTALFVADPKFDPGQFPLFDRLRHALTEVNGIIRGYPRHIVLSADSATQDRLTAALPGATLLHVSAHAVFDDARPERSYVIFAPSAQNLTGRVTAADFAAMELTHLSLVVLSACTTARGGRGRAAGYSGLTGALLAAGAGGVVGSTWDVDDAATAAFMRDFHAAYGTLGDAGAARRHAQQSAILSKDPQLASPAVWAAFRYTGR
jgi:CHAT domain-containing protein